MGAPYFSLQNNGATKLAPAIILSRLLHHLTN